MDLPHIKIYRSGRTAEMTIDGKPFPWPIAEDGAVVEVDTNNVPTITLTLVAARVEVENVLD